MIRVGVAGFGFMGNMHARCYQALDDAELAAICDIDASRLSGQGDAAGNIPGTEEPLDLAGVALFTDFDKMLKEAQLDAVAITLPTYMHVDYTVKALQAGIDVLCEKPMATKPEHCDRMIAAAEKSGRLLQIGHCIRFWPEYAKTKEFIDTAKYGTVKAATFQRLSATPTWSWDNWLMDGTRSGGAAMDLHIHDTDFVHYVFGMPKAVIARGVRGPSADFDHIVTSYIYDDEKAVTAEGGWIMPPAFGFEMSFNIILERATIVYDCTRAPAFRVCPAEGDAFEPEVDSQTGYTLEMAHFIKAASGDKVEAITTPQQSKDSLRIIEAEKESAASGTVVALS